MSISRLTVIGTFASLCFMAATTAEALAELPPHTPGSICATQSFWCWTQPYGIYGQPCACPTAGGNAPGTYV